jgi:hypothetical protein
MTSGFAPRPPFAGSALDPRVGTRVAPRASDHAVAGMGTLCLKAFLVAQFLSLTRLFFSTQLGDGITFYASLAGLLSVALLIPAVAAYGMRAGSPFGTLVRGGRMWAVGVVGLSAVLSLYGWIGKGYAAAPVAHDLAPYLVIVAAAVLGSLRKAWEDIDRLLLVLFVVGLLVNAIGMTEMSRVVTEVDSEDRAGIGIVAYRTQGVLAFWPLLFLTARLRTPARALLAFLGVFFVLAQQILFQKRAPTARVAVFVLVFLVVLPRLTRGVPARAEWRSRLLFLGTGVLAVVIAVSVAPWLFAGQLAGLLQRWSGQAYAGGAAGMLTTENERFYESAVFLKGMRAEDLALGRGFGGYFKPNVSWWGIWLEDVGEFGRRQLHVGALMPLFKGGLPLVVVYYSGLALALLRGFCARRDPVAGAMFFVLLVHALFLVQESWFLMSVSFDLVLVGLCMGYLLSRETLPRRAAPPALQGAQP